MNKYFLALLFASASTSNLYANDVEEVIVTSSFIDQTLSEIPIPSMLLMEMRLLMMQQQA